jgi:hypothetical protein
MGNKPKLEGSTLTPVGMATTDRAETGMVKILIRRLCTADEKAK